MMFPFKPSHDRGDFVGPSGARRCAWAMISPIPTWRASFSYIVARGHCVRLHEIAQSGAFPAHAKHADACRLNDIRIDESSAHCCAAPGRATAARGGTMECIETYTRPDGHSAFRTVQAFDASSVMFRGVEVSLSPPQPSDSVLMHEFGSGYFLDWHNPPCRQYVVILAGELEIAVRTQGTARRFAQGDIFLAGDLQGSGHTTRAIRPGRALVVNVRG
jgi:hypothetical protein